MTAAPEASLPAAGRRPAVVSRRDFGRAEDRATVPVSCLRAGETPRLSGEDADHVRALAEFDGELPPIVVHRDTLQVIDGRHRLQAARLRGDELIEVRFFDGDAEEAFIAAVYANRGHGLPLTLADRTAAAARILARCPDRSDRAVATITGLSPTTLAAIRRRHGLDDGAAPGRTGRDGRVRPVNSADGRRRAGELIAARPEASLRQIAKLAGVSPATVRDVRERLGRGEDPAPARQPAQQRRQGLTANSGPDRAVAEAPPPVADRADVLRKLSKDPSLRFTDSGRELLRLLFAHGRGPGGWQKFLGRIPPHSSYLVAKLARAYADEWLRFAAQLELRLDIEPHAADPIRAASGE
jgi:ParB-like chromosome segregation protein Spo0J